jgi:UDP-glucose 4-epimerase
VALRYFNPVGADPALRTGLQLDAPSHALGRLLQAVDTGEPFRVFGVDWPTRDGSALRDYVHVWDLALAHVAALERFDRLTAHRPFDVLNVGTGRGTTVLELLRAVERVTGRTVPVELAPRRRGDVVGNHCRTDRAARLLGWRPLLDLDEGIADALAWSRIRRSVLDHGVAAEPLMV